ncbi:D-alanyl-D-alanine carboxypeptidase family protein [Modestobacter versicolor]|uniref:D-alanyl-D-alanine carboxypeptidase family protein n=1 Tax=Modestobacter versicolor TaxID=429133 RepID=UPI0034DEE081
MTRIRATLAAGLSAGALAVALVAACAPAADSASAGPAPSSASSSVPGPVPGAVADDVGTPPRDAPDQRGPITAADGWLPEGQSLDPDDTASPALARLDPALLTAVQQAAQEAAAAGVEIRISSGWRSAALQADLLAAAVRRYGSTEEARRWVNTPERSTHVSGRAVDVASADAASWLSQHGDEFGLCQTYANELWHYELATGPGGTCPPQLADAAG